MTIPWLLTDPHFKHGMLVEAFHRPSNFEELIHNGWKRNVGPKDLLICLGDICLGQDGPVHSEYILTSPGLKVLVKGNHDKKPNSWYYDHGWSFVCDRFSDTFYGKKILFSHIPQKDAGAFDYNIHGHFHNTDHRSQEPNLQKLRIPKHRLYALEYHGYEPIKLERFLAICDTPENLHRVEAPCYPMGVLPGIPHCDLLHSHQSSPLILELQGEETPCDTCGVPLNLHK